MPEVQVIGPPGYGEVVPLDRRRHAGLAVRAADDFRWCSEMNASLLAASEFSRAARDYPIAFMRHRMNGEFMPVAVLGLRNQENLFVETDGRWASGYYIPAHLRRYPFCLIDAPAAGGEPRRRLVCVREDRLVSSNQPLFDATGQPTPRWETLQRQLNEGEHADRQTRRLSLRLESLGLLVGFDALAAPPSGRQYRMAGLYRVDEAKLSALPAQTVKRMMRQGELRAVYAHLMSLERFSDVMARVETRLAAA